MKWWKKIISRSLQSNKYGAQLSPVSTGALVGLAPQTKLQVPQIEIWNTINVYVLWLTPHCFNVAA